MFLFVFSIPVFYCGVLEQLIYSYLADQCEMHGLGLRLPV